MVKYQTQKFKVVFSCAQKEKHCWKICNDSSLMLNHYVCLFPAGIILVHDLTNKKSSQNLYRWSLEALSKDSSPTGIIVSNGDYDREQFAENSVPLLLIGTKFDQIPENKRNDVLTRTAFLSEDFNAEEINLDCTNPRYLAAGSSNAVKLSRFFDKVIEKRYFTRDPSQMQSFTDRRRFNFKSLHSD
ncbi:unnamed protein product [Leuciscus chuanchicus]